MSTITEQPSVYSWPEKLKRRHSLCAAFVREHHPGKKVKLEPITR